MAYISALSPTVLLLDEITNNLDITTRKHVIDTLNAYPGTIIAVSHDYDFLHAIGIEHYYQIDKKRITASAIPTSR